MAWPRTEASVSAEIGGGVPYLRQHRGGDPQQVEKFLVPAVLVDIVEQGPGGVGGVGGVLPAAGEPPEQKGVDGAKEQAALPGQFAGAFDVIEQPAELGAGKIGIEEEAGLGGDHRVMAIGGKSGAEFRGTSVLPDDGPVDRFAGLAIPDDGGLALVGDADGGDICGRQPGLLEGPAAGSDGRGPDLLGVVFDPAGLREILPEFLLGRGDDLECIAEDNGPGRGGALVDC